MAADLAKAEWKKIKKTRGAQTGTLTKLHNKLLHLFKGDIATYDLKMLGRAMASITKAEAAYEQTIEDASNIVDVEGEEVRTETEEASEEAALDIFTDKVEEVRALADEMITLK